MFKEVDRFRVRSEDGQEFTVLERVEMIDASTKAEPNRQVPGLNQFRTLDGMHVQRLDADTYEIVQLGLRVSRL